MLATLRALMSVLALLGFYLIAIAIIVGLVVAGIRQGSGANALREFLVAGLVAVGVGVALYKVAKFKPGPMPGVDVSRDQAPELWQLVEYLAELVDTRPPSQIRLVPEVNAAVSEDTRMLGLIGGTRRLYLGVPLLQGVTVTQLAAILSHELGHYSESHTRLGPLSYRGRQAVVATSQQVGGVIGIVLTQYAKFYILLSQWMSRSQELEADRAMVEVAGRTAAQGSLREVPVLAAAWGFYMNSYVSVGWEDGLAPVPEEFFVGFSHLLMNRRDELAGIRAEAPPAETSKWDSHPPISQRIAAMEKMADRGGRVREDVRSATVIIPSFWNLATAVATETVAYDGMEPVVFHELVHLGSAAAGQRFADRVYHSAAQLTGQTPATLHTLLQMSYDGRFGELVQDVSPGAPPEAAIGIFDVVVRSAAIQADVARYQLSWTGPAGLVGSTGALIDTEQIAQLAADPATVSQAAHDIAQLGIDSGRVGQQASMADVPTGS